VKGCTCHQQFVYTCTSGRAVTYLVWLVWLYYLAVEYLVWLVLLYQCIDMWSMRGGRKRSALLVR
jgi:hypothetical protein